MIDIKVPTVGESINEVTLVKWLKKDGDYVDRDEVIAELESEKATFEVNAEKAGVLRTVGKEGDTLNIGDVLAQIDESAARPQSNGGGAAAAEKKTATEAMAQPPIAPGNGTKPQPEQAPSAQAPDVKATPVASAIIADRKVDPKNIQPSG